MLRDHQLAKVKEWLQDPNSPWPKAYVPKQGEGAVPIEQTVKFDTWSALLKGGTYVLDLSNNPNFTEFRWRD